MVLFQKGICFVFFSFNNFIIFKKVFTKLICDNFQQFGKFSSFLFNFMANLKKEQKKNTNNFSFSMIKKRKNEKKKMQLCFYSIFWLPKDFLMIESFKIEHYADWVPPDYFVWLLVRVLESLFHTFKMVVLKQVSLFL